MSRDDLIEQIVTLRAFQDVFADLKAADPTNGTQIEAALRACVKETHTELAADDVPRDRLEHLLYREVVELKTHSAPYLNYERELAQRVAVLWKFAVSATDEFFNRVFDALAVYFEAKKAGVLEQVERESDWYTGLLDAAKKTGEVVNLAALFLKRGVRHLEGTDVLARALKELSSQERDELVARLGPEGVATLERIASADASLLDTRDVVEKMLAEHLAPDTLARDLGKILEDEWTRYQDQWRQTIHAQTPDLREVRTLLESSSSLGLAVTPFELGWVEQTLTVGLGAATVGTLSLAAGWHTLAYGMAHVFAPAAAVLAVAAAGVAYLTRRKDLEKRQERVRKAVDAYHRQCLLELDTGQRAELGGRTLRQAVGKQARDVVENTLRGWERAISGKLTTEHYRRLGAAFAQHLLLIQECLDSVAGVKARAR